MYDALKMHEENKHFEAYLLIKHRIEQECKNVIRGVLLEKLEQKYLTGGKEHDLMDILKNLNH